MKHPKTDGSHWEPDAPGRSGRGDFARFLRTGPHTDDLDLTRDKNFPRPVDLESGGRFESDDGR